MTNVISFPAAQTIRSETAEAHLICAFAQGRRAPQDVFWLKENAEVLGILAATGCQPGEETLALHRNFYRDLPERLRFFPQYYRFLLSICLDLEALGLEGNQGEALAHWVAREGLDRAELSDLQRAEARRLLARRGAAPALTEDPLAARLRAFIGRPQTFAMPNKKAAYELTHSIFYLSEYGQVDPGIDQKAMTSLEYAGLLAYLDQNMDLLAEVCTALHFAGRAPSPIWLEAVAQCHESLGVAPGEGTPLQDDYHLYLVTGWMQRVLDRPAFRQVPGVQNLRFRATHHGPGALRPMSECLLELGRDRVPDWHRMRGRVMPYLGARGHEILMAAERSSDKFEAFFEGFARAAAR